ncbi:helix-hairpin-helix domain-containing protein [Chengkuizengella sediminis]|uniref:helix-hairpin-helix domain-containing protein n=1 Tax=Chengkuizengella sediminis TaxID=1885917 RepID=UPI0013899E25|nr:helix-hairpin-helix domain-containing protein [Chengkuizengella sediminis]NDI35438.1 Pathogenicity locus [Chengkuizengella sediminis]
MKSIVTPKLPLTDNERRILRKMKIRLNQIHTFEPDDLKKLLEISPDHAQYLVALASFQQIPSIGAKLATDIIENLGIYTLEELKKYDGSQLLDEFEKNLNYWTDPCVEDHFRCLIYHAKYPGSDRKWFDFTEERKKFRMKHGYPETRPKVGWQEMKKDH